MLLIPPFLSFPLRSREGSISVRTTHPACREDIETLIECLRISLDSWPTLEQLMEYHTCPKCGWTGDKKTRIPREDEGKTGCPLCGAKTSRYFQPRTAPEVQDAQKESLNETV